MRIRPFALFYTGNLSFCRVEQILRQTTYAHQKYDYNIVLSLINAVFRQRYRRI
jgi:hypothetical protein